MARELELVRTIKCAWTVGVILLAALPGSAQSSVYYVTNGDQSWVLGVQNGSIVHRWNTGIYCYPIAVANGEVHVADGQPNRNAGKAYDLTGNFVGNLQVRVGPSYSLDSTSDGTYNYWFVAGNVWRGDLDWGNATMLWPANGHQFGGLTWDGSSNTLWISSFSGTITEYSLAGTPLRSWTTGQPDEGLAWEPATDTLWMYRQGSNTFRQYDKNGNLLGSFPWNNSFGDNVIGGEFETTAAGGTARITAVSAMASEVGPGQSGIAVSMTIENTSMTDMLQLLAADIDFTGTADRTSEYVVTPDPANPSSVAAQSTEVLQFTVDVATSATEETITLDGSMQGMLSPSGRMVSTASAQQRDTWDVVGARPQVRTVDASPAMVAQGSVGNPVSVSIENVGRSTWALGNLFLSFVGSADRSAEYQVSRVPGGPTNVAPGATEWFDLLVEVDPAATIETITLDVITAQGTDVVTFRAQADSGADVTDSWDVVACGTPLCGDCDGDMSVTILDALSAAQHSAGLITLVGVAFTSCNVIGAVEPSPSAAVTILDALTLAQSAAGLPAALMCC